VLQSRCRLFREAQQDLKLPLDWEFVKDHYGIKTFYRREDDGTLSIKLEGEMEGVPLFDQMCVLKEVDLHYKWAPFCSCSLTIADLGKLDTVGWFLIGLPNFGLARDGCFRAVGCDNIKKDGTILLVAQGVQDRKPEAPPPKDTTLSGDAILNVLDIPPVPTRRGSDRITINKFQAMFMVTSPTSVRTHIVANIDPNLSFLPQSLLDFIMKQVAGVLLSKLQVAAKKIEKNPAKNDHAKLMRQESGFYKDWLMAKIVALCKERDWKMPNVSVFDYKTDDEWLTPRAGTTRARARTNDFFAPDKPDVDQHYATDHGGAPDHHKVLRSTTSATADDISELSVASTSGLSSRLRNNPVALYVREMEDKTRLRKEDQIAASRRMAAQRLKPKHLSLSETERLHHLKLAKARRSPTAKGTQSTANGTHKLPDLTAANPLSPRRRIGLPRLSLVFALMFFLFIVLNPERLLPPIIFQPAASWKLVALEDMGALVYISLCGVLHFAVCQLALDYAFETLEIGMKAGERIKQFYSNNVMLVAAALSVCIVAFSLVKATTKVTLLAILRGIVNMWSLLSEWMRNSEVISGADVFLKDAFSMATTYRTFNGDLIIPAPVQSLAGSLHASVTSRLLPWIEFVQETIGSSHLVSWRKEVFDTAKPLFLYTSFFLLTVLILFKLFTRGKTTSSQERGSQSTAPPERVDKAGGFPREALEI
jgi:hypothetical protein